VQSHSAINLSCSRQQPPPVGGTISPGLLSLGDVMLILLIVVLIILLVLWPSGTMGQGVLG